LLLLTHENTKKMVTYFNKKDLVKFGEYLLSDKRTDRIKETQSKLSLPERLNKVYHTDVENFLELAKRGAIILLLFLSFGCSLDDSQSCKSVKGKQIKYLSCGGGVKCAVFYFMLEGDSQQIEVSEADYNNYDLKEEYCK
jgi:hypothetical protein